MEAKTEFKIDIPEESLHTENIHLGKQIEVLYLSAEDIKNIKEIIKKYPNLKKVVLNITPIKQKHIGDISNLIEAMKYIRSIDIVPFLDIEDVRRCIKEAGLDERIVLSDDGICFINIDRIEESNQTSGSLKINLRDIEKIGVEKLSKLDDDVIIVVDNVGELSVDELKRYIDAGINISRVKVFSKENTTYSNRPYEAESYCDLREKLEELVAGIDVNLPEIEKFAEVYRRVCSSIEYDEPAGYPKTDEEKAYEEREKIKCRNLYNGLLKKKCVCAGFADILRNALAMVGVKSEVVKGTVIIKEIKKEDFDIKKLKYAYVYKQDDEKVTIADDHAWNKVRIDGVWYNVDATWDINRIRKGKTPKHCLRTDSYIREKDKKVDFKGHKCETEIDRRIIEKLFDRKHIFIGKYKLPNLEDAKRVMTKIKRTYVTGKRKKDGTVSKIAKKLIKIIKPAETTIVEEKNVEETTSLQTWDLEYWGIDKESFLRHINEAIQQVQNNQNPSKTYSDNDKIQ